MLSIPTCKCVQTLGNTEKRAINSSLESIAEVVMFETTQITFSKWRSVRSTLYMQGSGSLRVWDVWGSVPPAVWLQPTVKEGEALVSKVSLGSYSPPQQWKPKLSSLLAPATSSTELPMALGLQYIFFLSFRNGNVTVSLSILKCVCAWMWCYMSTKLYQLFVMFLYQWKLHEWLPYTDL